jgi:hypothetical protein
MKKNILSVAVATGVAVSSGLAVANPMFISPDNTGEVLIFPYYNAENGNATSMHVVNTTADAKVLKVRFREYKASLEVLDFNVFLSPKDHFSWTVAAHPEGVTAGGAILTRDNSCTYPALGSDNYAPYEGGTTEDGALYQPFVNFEFSKAADSGDERTLAGYVEVIEMGIADTGTVSGAKWKADVTHTATGVPKACSTIVANYEGATGIWKAGGNTGIAAPTGGLYGISYHLNANDAAAFGIEPTVIDDWASGPTHYLAGSEFPNLGQGETTSRVMDPTDGHTNFLDFTVATAGGWQAVNSLIMTTDIMNDVMTNDVVGAMTDWVITFPTKHAHVNEKATAAAVIKPFTDNYKQGTSAVAEKLACEYVATTYYDREEQTVVPEEQPGFSPQPEFEVDYQKLCYEVTTLTWDNSVGALNGGLGEQQASFIFEDGWAELSMSRATYVAAATVATSGGRTILDDSGVEVEGLPAIGFMATKYVNGVGNPVMNYGHVADHKTSTVISDLSSSAL